MGAIRVHEFISLDSVIDTPSWTFQFGFDPRMGEAIGRITMSSDGILLGRTTYEMFEPTWSKRTVEEDPGAPFFNDTRKYVVSSTLTTATWRNSEIIGGYDPKRIQQLKEESTQGLYVSGSGTLVRALIADGLVDELHLFVYPVTRSAGSRPFRREPAARHVEAGRRGALRQRRHLPETHPGVVSTAAVAAFARLGELELYYETRGTGPPLVLIDGSHDGQRAACSDDTCSPRADGSSPSSSRATGTPATSAGRCRYELLADDIAALLVADGGTSSGSSTRWRCSTCSAAGSRATSTGCLPPAWPWCRGPPTPACATAPSGWCR